LYFIDNKYDIYIWLANLKIDKAISIIYKF
jgi:hypothetical protein